MKTMWRKILCTLNRHDYVNDNAGISSDFTIHRMNYYHCRYCPKFKLEHPFPIPVSYIKMALKQKTVFDYGLNKRVVLFEKTMDKHKGNEVLYIDFRYEDIEM